MKEINFINEQVDKIIEFDPKKEYSDSYKHPKDRVRDFVSICENENQIYNVLRIVKNKADAELGEYEYGEAYSFTGSFYEHYRSFHNDLMTEVDSVIELIGFPQAKDDLVSVEEVEEEIPELNNLENRTKIILMQELGILSLLKKEESFKNATNLAKFIAELFSGKKDDVNKVYESIRTDLSYILDKKAKKTPYTPRQCKKVNSLLSMYGLPQMK